MSFVRDTAAGEITIALAGGTSGLAVGSLTPLALGVASAGSSANASREDHVHQLPTVIDITAAAAIHTHDAAAVTSGTLDIGRIPTIGYTALSGVPVSFNPSTHTHDAAAIASGTIDTARLPATVSALNALTGGITIAAGANVTVSTASSTITIAASGIGEDDVVDGGMYGGRLILSNTISFTQHPADTTAAFRSATFSSQATTSAGGLSLRYQWQRSDDGGTTWADIYGARSKTLTVSQLTYAADNNDRYRVVASSLAAQSVASNAAKLTFLSSNWGQLGTTLGSTATGHLFGKSVCVGGQGSGTVIAVASPGPADSYGGAVRAYQWNGSGWSQRGSAIEGTTFFTSNGDTVSNIVGRAIALSRDGACLAIATRNPQYTPAPTTAYVRVYNWSGIAWVQTGSSGIPFFTDSLAINNSGTIVACGMGYFSSEGLAWRGITRIYEYSGSAWTQKGQDLLGVHESDRFGTSVSLSADGNTLAVGAYTQFYGDGYVSVYRWIANAWSLVGRVGRPASTPTDPNATTGDHSGEAISLSADGSVLAVGVPFFTGSISDRVGMVRVYTVQSNSVTQRGGNLTPASNNSQIAQGYFGYTVNISDDGNSLAASDLFTSGSDYRYRPRIRTYSWSGAAWTQYGDPIIGELSDACDGHAISISSAGMSGDGVVVAYGAECGTGDVTDSGVVRVYEYAG
jgi:hypothetical protein